MSAEPNPLLSLEDELALVVETGLYESEQAFLSDAVHTLRAARPDLRRTMALRLYQKGSASLGWAATWAGLSIEDMKQELAAAGISREAPESPEQTEDMARRALAAVRRAAP